MLTNKDLWPEYEELKEIKIPGSNGLKLIPRFRHRPGSYEPDLLFLIDQDNIRMQFSNSPFGNIIPDGKLTWIEGKICRWKDKDGAYIDTLAFRPKAYRAEHALVKVEWGGPNNPTRGVEWETFSKLALYSKRCESISGNEGVNWYIFRIGFVYKDEAMIAALKKEYEEAPTYDVEIDEQ